MDRNFAHWDGDRFLCFYHFFVPLCKIAGLMKERSTDLMLASMCFVMHVCMTKVTTNRVNDNAVLRNAKRVLIEHRFNSVGMLGTRSAAVLGGLLVLEILRAICMFC